MLEITLQLVGNTSVGERQIEGIMRTAPLLQDSIQAVSDSTATLSSAPQDHTLFLIVAIVALIAGLYILYQTEFH